MWPAHEAHSRAHHWFARNARQGWATCPFTQAGFVRVISNPAFSPHAVTVQEALALLVSNLMHRDHRFWPDNLPLSKAAERFRLVGHRQVTDAYLLGLAAHHRGKLATLDQGLCSMLPAGAKEAELIEII
jgi:toxin-antitoxin system PIN domain toxin